METEKAAVVKSRGSRRVGLKRTSISSKATLAENDTSPSEPKAVDALEQTAMDCEETAPKVLSPRLDSSTNDKESTEASSIETQNGDNEASDKPTEPILQSTRIEEGENGASSNHSEDFIGFGEVSNKSTDADPLVTKLMNDAQADLDSENNMSADVEKMDVDPEPDAAAAAPKGTVTKRSNAKKMKEDRIEENGNNSEDDAKTKETDGSFDNMKLLSEVSSEVTSSNDVSNTNANDTPGKAPEEIASEVTSSANNSPAQSSSRASGKSSSGRISSTESPAAASSRRSIASKKTSMDLSNPAFRRPFDFGWKRELVYRNSNELSARVMADIYYYTPAGKKIRSNREVSEHIFGTDLTTDNFTFFKEPLGVEDPEKEIIRGAKRVSSISSSPKKATPKLPKIPATKPARVKAEPNSVASPETPTAVVGPRAATARSFPRIKITPSQLQRGSPAGAKGGKGKGMKIVKAEEDGDMEMGLLPPTWNPTAAKGAKTLDPCSMHCTGVTSQIPSLQCRLCVCLYHPECVGLGALADASQLSYVCQNCQGDKRDGKPAAATIMAKIPPPPRLSAYSEMVAEDGAVATAAPPRLHRIPRLVDKPTRFTTVPQFVNVAGEGSFRIAAGAKTYATKGGSMVGGVTTWLPPSSTIQITSANAVPAAEPAKCVQSIATIAGKKYIVVSKQNVVSVTNASAQPREDATHAAGGPILPKPSYLLGGGHQNPPGVLLVPWTAAAPQVGSQQGTPAAAAAEQLYFLNGPSGHFVVSGMPGPTHAEAVDGPPSKKRKREAAAAGAVAGGSDKEAGTSPKRGKKSPEAAEAERNVMRGFANNMAVGYNAMKQVFTYLKVKELLRAAQVCKMWRDLAAHPSLWRVVRMKNSHLEDWEGFVTSIVDHETQQLDLRKMLLPNEPEDVNRLWRSFLKEISRAKGLVRIDLCRCPAYVIEELPLACPHLTIINALAIKCSSINLDNLGKLQDLTELRLKSMTGIHLTSSLEFLKKFTNMRHLSLTTFKDLGRAEPQVIGELVNLETLELGECCDFADEFGNEVITKLTKLTSLRLEKGQGKTCPTFSLLAGIKEVPTLVQLELVNFDVKAGFSAALAQCTNIKRLLLIPTYVTQSATTNHMVLAGVTDLKDSLSHFVWGVTHELLRVTELFIDQCDTASPKEAVKVAKTPKHPDSIPILRPDKSKATEWEGAECKSMSSTAGQVEILTLSNLQQVLFKSLPNTKIKILKVPFQATWRQSISEPTP